MGRFKGRISASGGPGAVRRFIAVDVLEMRRRVKRPRAPAPSSAGVKELETRARHAIGFYLAQRAQAIRVPEFRKRCRAVAAAARRLIGRLDDADAVDAMDDVLTETRTAPPAARADPEIRAAAARAAGEWRVLMDLENSLMRGALSDGDRSTIGSLASFDVAGWIGPSGSEKLARDIVSTAKAAVDNPCSQYALADLSAALEATRAPRNGGGEPAANRAVREHVMRSAGHKELMALERALSDWRLSREPLERSLPTIRRLAAMDCEPKELEARRRQIALAKRPSEMPSGVATRLRDPALPGLVAALLPIFEEVTGQKGFGTHTGDCRDFPLFGWLNRTLGRDAPTARTLRDCIEARARQITAKKSNK